MPAKKYNVLYVDDEPANLRVFKNTFRWHYNVFIAESGNEGLNILDGNGIDIVITDQRMPGITGTELLATIKQKYPSLIKRSILLSGYTDQAAIDIAVSEYKIFKYVNKPWDPAELGVLIEKAIDSL